MYIHAIVSRMFIVYQILLIKLGQFWNVPVTLTNTGMSVNVLFKPLPVYEVKVVRTGSPTRKFTGFEYPYTWDLSDEPCLYAGDGQGEEVIEGSYLEYQVKGIFATDFNYTRFRDTCP